MSRDFYTKSETDTTLGGMCFVICTKSDYDTMSEHNTTTLYFVTEDDKVTQYLGDIKLSSGTDTQGIIAGLLSGTNATISGNITTISQMNETEE